MTRQAGAHTPGTPQNDPPPHGRGPMAVLMLILFVPGLLVLVAVVVIMGPAWRSGSAVRPPAVTVAPVAPVADARPATGAGPAPQAGAHANVAGGSPPAGSSPAAPAASPVRLATDFSPARPAWEAALATASPEDGRRIVDVGIPGLVACSSCHGKAGVAPAGSPFPDLAGKQREYIAKQLMDFRAGTRSHPVMTPIARAMKDSDVGAAAAYIGGLPAAATPTRASGPARGESLDRVGDMALGLPACANCHGMGGAGVGPLLPSLAGEPQDYLIAQLHAFRSGSRSNDDGGVMRAFATRLSESDIRALAEFYAATK
jgi:cytochrome c553